MPTDQQLYDRGDAIRYRIGITIRNLHNALHESHRHIIESQDRRLRELDELDGISFEHIRASHALMGRRSL